MRVQDVSARQITYEVRLKPDSYTEKIDKEVRLKRVGGPFDSPPFPTLQVSPIGLVPKKDGDFRLIHHLSFPDSNSINHCINSTEGTVHYASIDDAAAIISALGPSSLLAKSDVKSAFRLWLVQDRSCNPHILHYLEFFVFRPTSVRSVRGNP